MAMAGVIMVYQKTDKAKKLNFILWPAMDALKNDFTANPSIILTRLSTPSPTVKSLTGLNLRSSLLSGITIVSSLKTKRAASI